MTGNDVDSNIPRTPINGHELGDVYIYQTKWTNNGDGSFIAKKGATLWGLQQDTGKDWHLADYVGDPKKLQIGQVVSYAPKDDYHSNINFIVDSNTEAVAHYYKGANEEVALGQKTINLLLNNSEHKQHEHNIRTGQTTSLNGNYKVPMIKEMFHIGRTTVLYETTIGIAFGVTIFTGFANDGFWDIPHNEKIEKYLKIPDDKIGTNYEFPGGKPYPYKPYKWAISFPAPTKRNDLTD